uniref:Family with sequence similarity 162 member A n=1 Tax=Labrus bergylta TaxID=56723 RepID=A0A3Q3FYP7_9LABR
MNFVGSRLSIGNFVGQRCRRVTETWSLRGMCNKPQETKAEPPPAAPAHASRAGFRVPGYRPSKLDRKMLVWSGRFKSADQIPELVSFEMIDAARNKARVKICYMMMGTTIAACLMMVFLGKRVSDNRRLRCVCFSTVTMYQRVYFEARFICQLCMLSLIQSSRLLSLFCMARSPWCLTLHTLSSEFILVYFSLRAILFNNYLLRDYLSEIDL